MRMTGMATPTEEKNLSALEKKRLYNKNRNREFRRLEAEEKNKLTRQIFQLEATIASLKQNQLGSALTWREIATVFMTELKESETQLHDLRLHVQRYETTSKVLHEWLYAPAPEDTKALTTTLMAHEDARYLAYEWITQRLYNNIPSVLHIASNLSPTFYDPTRCRRLFTNVERCEASYQLTLFSERMECTSLQVVAKCLYSMHFQPSDHMHILDTPGNNVVYMQRLSVFGLLRNETIYENVLVRQWIVDEDQYIICSQSISNDELHYPGPIQQDWTNWTIATMESPTQTKVISCTTMAGLRRDNALLPYLCEEPHLRQIKDDEVQWNELKSLRAELAIRLADYESSRFHEIRSQIA
ncbi:hypothetical protein THRCLA_01087 [Thraustotheca clavata]|uniref:Uncharacterized protein n=1 Tax=Thraustotheca clavata TaxID=74557 RepID=A0A1W0A9N2_9STRA|nr:hypothetical protein THRCLA_01087 [Thraustotheca clavata]